MDNLEANIMDKSMRSVFVGNIPYEATEEKLKDIFGEVGQVLSFKLVFDRETGKPKGYGFCEYRDQETALSAMRNLNGYEIGGRNLRVDNACTEKSRMEMQNLLNQPPVENPYGEPIQAEKAPEAISKAVASLPPEQMFELMKQMKLCIQNNPTEARQMLLQNPQLSYALLQAQVVMRIIDPHTAATLLHPPNVVPSTITPKEKPPPVPISINSAFAINPAPVQAPRNDFQPVPAPVISQSHQNSVFSGNVSHSKDKRMPMHLPTLPSEPAIPQDQSAYLNRHTVDRNPLSMHQEPQRAVQDVDLRSLDPRGGSDPRLRGMGDQDMRTLPGQLPNPLPPTIAENFSRDPRAGTFPADPRQQQRVDPRQKPLPPQPNAMPIPPQPVRPPQPQVQPPPQQQRPVNINNATAPNLGQAGASDQEKAALIMQVLQLSDEQIAMLPPEQRNSILVLKEQIAKSAHR